MQKTHISTTVTRTVVLGGHNYATTLIVTPDGVVAPIAAGADGIFGKQSDDDVTNHGSIVAAIGAVGGNGGVGIDLTAGGSIINRGSIYGGMPSYSSQGPVNGGNGVDIRGGTIINSGKIDGGSLYRGSNSNGHGGIGVDALSGGVTIMNSGTITGGDGTRFDPYGGSDTSGGVGVDLAAAGTLTSSGTIEGGYAGYGRGVAVELAQHSTFVNHGMIFGGNEESGGAVSAVNSNITNYGTIQGFNGYYYSRGGAVGVEITGGSLANDALIVGGNGNAADHDTYFPAAAGVDATDAAISNAGTIMGGSGLYGATGVSLADHASLNNTGMLLGGNGGYDYYRYYGNAGGAGITLEAATSATNSGIIQGGLGGGYEGYVGTGGIGGAGVSLSAGSMLTNAGTLSGGTGGNGTHVGGAGGDGADINGGTLVTSGTIIGGAGGMSPNGYGQSGNAVNFGTQAGTMIIDPGAVFEGAIAGSSSTSDTLVLAGTAAGTLSGFGSTITGITTISENAGGNWTLQGTVAGPGELDIGKRAQLTLSGGAARISTIAFASGGHATLTLGSPAGVTSVFSGFGTGDSIDLSSVQGTSLSYADGTLSVLGANSAVLATLNFAGNYTLADFKLQDHGANTDIVYAGSAPEPNSHGGEPGLCRPGAVDTLGHFWLLHG